MSKHTPGPWKLEAGRILQTLGGEFYLSYGKDRYGNSKWKASYAELDANAHLIAAAPDLLAALEECLPIWSSGIQEPWVTRARAAIAKARGETV